MINRYKMAKHFTLTLTDTSLAFARKTDAIVAEVALDGIYVIRTSVGPEHLDRARCVHHDPSLSPVERASRSMKTIDLKVRSIHHRLADQVRPLFLCLLADYVEWHLHEAWRELLFADSDQATGATLIRSPRQNARPGPKRRSPAASTRMAPPSTASRHSSRNSPQSCATPAAPRTPTMPQPLR